MRALPLRSRARGHRGAVARSGAPATAPPRALALPHPPPRSKVACETAAKTGMIMIFGEITTKADVNYEQVIRDAIKQIGYDDVEKGAWGGLPSPSPCPHNPNAACPILSLLR